MATTLAFFAISALAIARHCSALPTNNGNQSVSSAPVADNRSQSISSAPAANNQSESVSSAPAADRIDLKEDDLVLGDLLSIITAEFVFNVAGDHILFPVPGIADDIRQHRMALIMARLLQKLHTMKKAYGILNDTAYEVARAVWPKVENQNLITAIVEKAIEEFERDSVLHTEYIAAKEAIEGQVLTLPPLHGKFASSIRQTMYDIRPEQLARAEKLLQDPSVKKVTMSVTFLKASEYEHDSLPRWVQEENRLASAVLHLAEYYPETRSQLQKAFDETLEENMDNFDVMFAGDDKVIFETLRRKIEGDAVLWDKIQRVMRNGRVVS